MTIEGSAINKFIFYSKEEVMSCGGDHNLRIWDLIMSRRKGVLTGHSDKITCFTEYGDGYVATASLDRTLRIWELKSGTCIELYRILSSNVRHIDFSKDCRLLLATHFDMKL